VTKKVKQEESFTIIDLKTIKTLEDLIKFSPLDLKQTLDSLGLKSGGSI